MHYKNLAFAALAGIVLLSSCVKDLETKSVTDIRNAKLEEIKSQTALNNAKAASEKTLSEAEALLKAAQADAQKAQAEYIRAQAEYQQALTDGLLIENQQKAAELEAALIQAEISKAKAQAELDRLAMKLESDLLDAQAELLKAMNDYEELKNERINDLATAYTKATITLFDAQKQLVKLKTKLTSAEQDLVDSQTSKEEMIVLNNELIATYEKIVAAYRENMGMTEEEVQAKLKELRALSLEKSVSVANAEKVYLDSKDKLDAARNSISDYLIMNVPSLDAYSVKVEIVQGWNPTINCLTNYFQYTFDTFDGVYYYAPFATLQEWNGRSDFSSVKDGKTEPLIYEGDALRTYKKAVILDPKAPANIATTFKESKAEQHKNNVALIQTAINETTARIAAFEKVIAEYDAETKDLEKKKEDLETKYQEAIVAEGIACDAVYAYRTSQVNEAVAALNVLDEASRNTQRLKGRIQELESNYIPWSRYYYDYIDEYYNNYYGYEICEYNVATSTKAVSDGTDEVKGKTTARDEAKTAYEAQLKVVAPLKEAMDKAYTAYREKYLAVIAGTAESYSDEWTAYENAVEAFNIANGNLNTLKENLESAQDNLDRATGNLKSAQDELNFWKIELKKAKEKYDGYVAELEKCEKDLEEAILAENEAEKAYLAAVEKYDEHFDAKLRELNDAWLVKRREMKEIEKEIDNIDTHILSIRNQEKTISGTYESLVDNVFYSFEEAGSWYINEEGVWCWYPFNYSYYKGNIEGLKVNLKTSQEKLEKENTEFADFNKKVDEWLAKLTSIVESEAAYSADIDALNELEKTTFALYKEWKDAVKALEEVVAEGTALTAEETEIKDWLDEIEALKAENADITAITEKEDLIAKLKVKIANKEAEIEVYKKLADDAKAALDAALAEENSTEE